MKMKKARIFTASFVSVIVATAVTTDNVFLAVAGIAVGVMFLTFVRSRTKEVVVDERVQSIGGQAARITYVIMSVLLSTLAVVFIFIGKRTGGVYIEALGTIFCYIVCLNLAIYSIMYKYLDRKHG